MGRLPIDLAGSSRAYEVIDVCLTNYYERLGLKDGYTGAFPGYTDEQIDIDDKADYRSENLPFQDHNKRN